MRRIVILGTSGSGKTTLARHLAQRLNVARIEMDALSWEANWTPAEPEVLRRRVEQAIAHDEWVLDGNYSALRGMIWPHADTFVWLDYPMTIVFSRLVMRTFRRWWVDEELWSGNRETLWKQFCTKDSIFLWAITTWRRRRYELPDWLREQKQLGKHVFRFRARA